MIHAVPLSLLLLAAAGLSSCTTLDGLSARSKENRAAAQGPNDPSLFIFTDRGAVAPGGERQGYAVQFKLSEKPRGH